MTRVIYGKKRGKSLIANESVEQVGRVIFWLFALVTQGGESQGNSPPPREFANSLDPVHGSREDDGDTWSTQSVSTLFFFFFMYIWVGGGFVVAKP